MKLEYSDAKKTAAKLKFRTKAFIDGKFVHAASGKTYVSINPAIPSARPAPRCAQPPPPNCVNSKPRWRNCPKAGARKKESYEP